MRVLQIISLCVCVTDYFQNKGHLPHPPHYWTLPPIDENIVVGQFPLKKVCAEDSAQVAPLQLSHHFLLCSCMQAGYVFKDLFLPRLLYQRLKTLWTRWGPKPVKDQLSWVSTFRLPPIKGFESPAIAKRLKDVAIFMSFDLYEPDSV